MKKDLEPKPTPVELDVLQAEKLVKEPMKASDPGKMDFSEDFFNQLHDKIMAQVEHTEIQPKAAENPGSLPKLLRLWQAKAGSKFNTPLMALGLMILIGSLLFNSFSPHAKSISTPTTMDVFLSEALRSPDGFEAMVSGSLGQSDFLVDVASRNFDHLNLHDFDEIFGASSVGFTTGSQFTQHTR